MKLLLLRFASRLSDFYKAHVFWRKIDRALALHKRGEIRTDGLQLTSAKVVLHIEWLARDIHPWDRDLPVEKAERLFAQQCLNDANAAINRIFAEVPVLDTIEVCVKRDVARPPILCGSVHRDSLGSDHCTSVGMKLRNLGLTFRMNNFHLEEIEAS